MEGVWRSYLFPDLAGPLCSHCTYYEASLRDIGESVPHRSICMDESAVDALLVRYQARGRVVGLYSQRTGIALGRHETTRPHGTV